MDVLPSPNHGPRPPGVGVRLIVLHGTEGTDEGDLAWLRKRESAVSYHYLIQRTGRVIRLVEDARRAWHAGKSAWMGESDCNDFAIGIGLSNKAPAPYTDAQYRVLGELLAGLLDRHELTLRDVVGHYHVAPGRKTDPGYHFEWGRAIDETLIHWGGPRGYA
jgi:N-acetyl-anhydromuramyl-L-alanine amidase AmpD